jgi:hypothetical protein
VGNPLPGPMRGRSTIHGGSGISTNNPQRLSADDPNCSSGTAGNKTPTPGREHQRA